VVLGGSADNVGLGATVNAGTLVLAKASSGSPAVHAVGGGGLTVNAGGTAQLAGTGGDQIYDNATVTLNGGTFDLNGTTETIGTLNGTAGSTLTNNNSAASGALTVTGGGAYAGIFGTAGNGIGLTVAGSGQTLTLSGTADNSFLAVTVNAGTLVLAKTSSSGVHALGNGLTVNAGTTAQLAGTGGDQIYDGASVTLAGGTFDLNGRSETIGNLTGSAGNVSNSVSRSTATLTVGGSDGADGSGTFAGVIANGAGTVALVKAGTGTMTLTGSNTFTGGTTVNAGTLVLGDGTDPTTLAGFNPFITYGDGGVAVTVNPGGTLVVRANATVSGGGGAFADRNYGANGGAGVSYTGGGSLTNAGTINGGSGGTGGFGFTNGNGADGGSLTNSGTVNGGGGTVNGAGVAAERHRCAGLQRGLCQPERQRRDRHARPGHGPAHHDDRPDDDRRDDPIAGRRWGIFLNGPVTTNANSTTATNSVPQFLLRSAYSSPVAFNVASGNGGIYDLTVSSAIVDGGDGGPNVLVKSGAGSMLLTGTNTYSGGTQVTGGTLAFQQDANLGAAGTGIGLSNATLLLNAPGGTALTVPRPITLAGSNTVNPGTTTTLTLSGTISGTGSLNTAGLATTVLSGSNTYTGGTTVSNGVLDFTADANLGNPSGTVTLSAGTLQLTGANAVTSARSVSMTGGQIAVADAAGILNLAGPVSGTINKYGPGTLVLTGNNSGLTLTNVFAGTLAFYADANLNSVVHYPVNLYGGTTLQFNRASAVTTTRAINLQGSATIAVADPAGSLTLNGTTGVESNLVSFTKAGPGTLVLNGNNLLGGPMIVNAGTLEVINGISGINSTLTLNGGTLASGVSTRIGPAVVAGSGAHVIAPGGVGSVGTLMLVGGLTTAANTTLDFDLGAPVAGGSYTGDLIAFPGNNTGFNATGGTITFGSNPTLLGNYRLFSGTFGSPTLSNLTLPAAPSHETYALSTTADSGFIDLVVNSSATATSGQWASGTGGNWSSGSNWTGIVPSQAGDAATFASAPGLTANGTVTLDVAETVGQVTFNHATASYTIAGTNTLTLDNNGSSASINVLAGSHAINAPVALTGYGVTITAAASTNLSIGGVVSGGGGLTLGGGGTLTLTAQNAFTGGTTVNPAARARAPRSQAAAQAGRA
jgi:fibronectin-binding autotransporter adhesin